MLKNIGERVEEQRRGFLIITSHHHLPTRAGRQQHAGDYAGSLPRGCDR